jgi:hypothetical protein
MWKQESIYEIPNTNDKRLIDTNLFPTQTRRNEYGAPGFHWDFLILDRLSGANMKKGRTRSIILECMSILHWTHSPSSDNMVLSRKVGYFK